MVASALDSNCTEQQVCPPSYFVEFSLFQTFPSLRSSSKSSHRTRYICIILVFVHAFVNAYIKETANEGHMTSEAFHNSIVKPPYR